MRPDAGLPKLPGMTMRDDLSKKKVSGLKYVNGIPVVYDTAPADVMASLGSTMKDFPAEASGYVPKKPAFVEYDRKVCRFFGYFKESVEESRSENFRVRPVTIYFYLEDESIQVLETRTTNSGMPQGAFIKRHRIPKADGTPFTISDLNVGVQVKIYGRDFRITGCDEFTRKFLLRSGIDVGAEEEIPGNPHDAHVKSLLRKGPGRPDPKMDHLTGYMEAQLGRASHTLVPDRLRKFLQNDRKVLRFFAVWDDRKSLYGDRRPYIIHYYLATDDVEVLEVNEPNSGRDLFPVFLKKNKLPKGSVNFQQSGHGGSHYTVEDFRIGNTINVLSREFLLYECDPFTKDWLIKNMGLSIEDFPLINVIEKETPLPEHKIPPWNGFGSDEDSLQSCLALMPKAPKKDVFKLMENDKKLMRFKARFVPGGKKKVHETDMDRVFVISFFLSDDTVSIFEPPVRNSGIIGGKFLERKRVYNVDTGRHFSETDLFIGAKVILDDFRFELLEADEYSLNYMESNDDVFPNSNISMCLDALAGRADVNRLREVFLEMDTDASGFVSGDELMHALRNLGINLVPQQVVTLVRHFDRNNDNRISIEEFLGAFGIKIALE